MIASEVRVQMTMESMSGSHMATNPSVAGFVVFDAACAMPAEPIPAALENSARWMPTIATPTAPPATPLGLKAPVNMSAKACGICPALRTRMTRIETK